MSRLPLRARAVLTTFFSTVSALALVTACGSSGSPPPPGTMGMGFGDACVTCTRDAGMTHKDSGGHHDAKKPTDATMGMDAAHDVAHDVAVDVAHDVAVDVAHDVAVDVAHDVAVDHAVADAPKDVTSADANTDAPADAKLDVADATDATDALPFDDANTGHRCTLPGECASGVCAEGNVVVNEAGVARDAGSCTTHTCNCQAPSCTDGVKNGTETDVDCGGLCPNKCIDAQGCQAGSDCVTGVCGGVVGQDGGAGATCQAPSCGDGVKNGTETDVDCGSSGTCPHGETCQKCPGCTTGEACNQGTDCTSTICNGGNVCSCPTGMTESVSSPPYCVDTYEVTFAQYQTFLNLGVAVGSLPSECSFKTTFQPQGLTHSVNSMSASAQNPVTNVDWCDALAYCEHTNGKHLCGTVGIPRTGSTPPIAGGGPVPYPPQAVVDAGADAAPPDSGPPDAGTDPVNTPAIDEWYNACSGQGSLPFFYAVTYDPGFCNGIDSPAQRTSGQVDVPPGNRNTMGVNDTIATNASACIFDGCNNPPDVFPTVRGIMGPRIVSCKAGPLNQCVPATTCTGQNCGQQQDGCEGVLNCGGGAGCTAPATCGGAGNPGNCGTPPDGGTPGCVPKTCADLHHTCGQWSDGCGGVTVDCSGGVGCTAPETCSGDPAHIGKCGLAVLNPNCEATYTEGSCTNSPGMFDMSGNVAEWENSCNGNSGAGDNCLVRGGSYDSPDLVPGDGASLSCGWSTAQAPMRRDTTAPDVGFRCCL